MNYTDLNAKHQELLQYLELRNSEKSTLRNIIAGTSIESIGSASFAIDYLIKHGFIRKVSRSRYELMQQLNKSQQGNVRASDE